MIQRSYDDDGAGPDSAVITKYAFESLSGDVSGAGSVGNAQWNAWADLDNSGSLTTRRLYEQSVDAVFARMDSSGNVAWYLKDHLGSVRDMTDGSGTLKDHIDFDGWGNITSETHSSFGDRYKYTSREWDGEIQLQLNRARWYDPATSRWISEDPERFDAGDSNLYRYVNSQPTAAPDPSGLSPSCGGGQGGDTKASIKVPAVDLILYAFKPSNPDNVFDTSRPGSRPKRGWGLETQMWARFDKDGKLQKEYSNTLLRLAKEKGTFTLGAGIPNVVQGQIELKYTMSVDISPVEPISGGKVAFVKMKVTVRNEVTKSVKAAPAFLKKGETVSYGFLIVLKMKKSGYSANVVVGDNFFGTGTWKKPGSLSIKEVLPWDKGDKRLKYFPHPFFAVHSHMRSLPND